MAVNKLAASLKRMNTSSAKILKKADKLRADHKEVAAIEAARLIKTANHILTKCGGSRKIAALAGHHTTSKKSTKRK
jgi:hypothetical protein